MSKRDGGFILIEIMPLGVIIALLATGCRSRSSTAWSGRKSA